jgi:branched-chain amino acid transport system substrate-binding protein
VNKLKIWVPLLILVLVGAGLLILGNPGHETSKGAPSSVSDANQIVRVGAILPLTGPAAFLGEMEKKGIEAAKQLLEAEKGVRIEIQYEDSKNEAKSAIAGFVKLTSVDKPDVVLATHSGVCGPLSEYISNQQGATGPLLVCTIVASTKITENNSQVVRVYPSGRDEALAMASYAYDKLGSRRAAIIYQNDDYGLDGLQQFTATFKEKGGEVVRSESFEKTATDHKSLVAKVMDSQPDSIYIVGNTPAYALVFKQLMEAGYQGNKFSGSALDVGKFRKIAGESSVSETVYTSVFAVSARVSESLRFQQFSDYLSTQGAKPGLLTVYPAVSFEMIVDSVIDGVHHAATDLVRKMVDSQHDTIIGNIGFDENRNAKLDIYLRRVKNIDLKDDVLLEVYPAK